MIIYTQNIQTDISKHSERHQLAIFQMPKLTLLDF